MVASPGKSVPLGNASASGRMAAVQDMAKLQRRLFEVEREFVRTATTLIYRVGEPELKYLLCQHVWESASHARFLRERVANSADSARMRTSEKASAKFSTKP